VGWQYLSDTIFGHSWHDKLHALQHAFEKDHHHHKPCDDGHDHGHGHDDDHHHHHDHGDEAHHHHDHGHGHGHKKKKEHDIRHRTKSAAFNEYMLKKALTKQNS